MKSPFRTLQALALMVMMLALLAGPTLADEFRVTTTSDSGPGSLREAIADANANPGLDRIEFNIPGAGPHTISPGSTLPPVTDVVVIAGYTEPGAQENTLSDGSDADLRIELDGTNAGAGADGLVFASRGSTVQGLRIGDFSGDGVVLAAAGNTVEGNHIGTSGGNAGAGVRILDAPDNLVGGGAQPRSRNVISGNGVGVRISGRAAQNNRLVGNYIGTAPSGTVALGNAAAGVLVDGAPENNIGSAATALSSNLISGNGSAGIEISGSNARANRVANNRIGTDRGGTADLGNAAAGVLVDGAPGNDIGGLFAVAGNTISGNDGSGVTVTGEAASGNHVIANRIGTDRTGALALGNSGDGVRVIDAPGGTVGDGEAEAGNVISANGGAGVVVSGAKSRKVRVLNNHIGVDDGGTLDLGNAAEGVLLTSGASGNFVGGIRNEEKEENIVAFNGGGGVVALSGTSKNAILSNAIFSNDGLGIDLGDDGVSPNDPKDRDAGPNTLLNFPDLTSAQSSNATATVRGMLQAAPNSSYSVQLFASPSADPSQYGEGKRLLGRGIVKTNRKGKGAFSITVRASAGEFVTATTSTVVSQSGSGSSSEFSRAVPVQ